MVAWVRDNFPKIFSFFSQDHNEVYRFFGFEENERDGSYWYVNDKYDEITAMDLCMINLDMIAVGDMKNIGNVFDDNDDLIL
jgi:hypothetical protein